MGNVAIVEGFDEFETGDIVCSIDEDAVSIEVLNETVDVFAIVKIVAELFSSVGIPVDKVSEELASFPGYDENNLGTIFSFKYIR